MSQLNEYRFELNGLEVVVNYDTSVMGITTYTAYIPGNDRISGSIGWPWNLVKLEGDIRRRYNNRSRAKL